MRGGPSAVRATPAKGSCDGCALNSVAFSRNLDCRSVTVWVASQPYKVGAHDMKGLIPATLAAVLAATTLATAKDTSFIFKGVYKGQPFAVSKLSADECGKLLV